MEVRRVIIYIVHFVYSYFFKAPLVNIKKAITKIKSEITEMDVRIGVLECTLLQAKLREKNMLDEDLRQSVNIF